MRGAARGAVVLVVLAAAGCARGPAPAAPTAATPPAAETLRVCADPDNLPFTDERGAGFENQLVAQLADELGARLEYVWVPRGPAWLRDTVGAGVCDVAPGVPAITDQTLVTAPYYRSAYFFVRRADTPRATIAAAEPGARRLRVGLQLVAEDYANVPPAHAVARHGLIDERHGYVVYGDDRRQDSSARVVRALVRGEIDLAVVWGPVAGFFALRQPERFELLAVEPGSSLPHLPLVLDVSLAVRPGDVDLRDRLDDALDRRRPRIDQLLAIYGVPRLDAPLLGAGAAP